MKTCNTCGTQTEDNVAFCPTCGSAVAVDSVYAPEYSGAIIDENPGDKHGNILAGVVGALLFSVIGGALYFVIYQAGIIAGFCGLVIFVLANFGYGLFAKNKDKTSLVALIVSIVVTLVMIFVAEYLCLSYEIFQIYKTDMGITFFDAVRATPAFLAESEVSTAVIKDLLFAYVFGGVACISNIMNTIKARKQKA